MEYRIRSSDDFQQVTAEMHSTSFPFWVSILKSDNRTKQQNRYIHKLFGVIAKQTSESTDQIKRECKYYQGCPILMAERPAFADFVRTFAHFTVEQKIAAMDFVSVTSVMNIDQLCRMTDAVFRKYTEQGLVLPIPEDKR